MKKSNQTKTLNQKYRFIFLAIGILLPLLTVTSIFFAIGLYAFFTHQGFAPIANTLYAILAITVLLGGIVAIYFCIKAWQIYKDFSFYKQSPISIKAALIYALATLVFSGLALACGIMGFNGTPHRADYLTAFFIIGFLIFSATILLSVAALIYFGLQKLIMNTN